MRILIIVAILVLTGCASNRIRSPLDGLMNDSYKDSCVPNMCEPVY